MQLQRTLSGPPRCAYGRNDPPMKQSHE
jgi:hypothetical protein